MKETWKPVKGFEGLYEVSDMGRVKSLPRKATSGGIMKLYTHKKNGYQCFILKGGMDEWMAQNLPVVKS